MTRSVALGSGSAVVAFEVCSLAQQSAAAAESLNGQAQQWVAAAAVFRLPPAGAHRSLADVETRGAGASVRPGARVL